VKRAVIVITAVGLLAILAGFVVVAFVTTVVYGTVSMLEALNP
jgi:hypothetical protein